MYWKTEPRPTTRSPFTCPKVSISSSVNPSLKYSFWGSALTLAKGRTATDGGVSGTYGRQNLGTMNSARSAITAGRMKYQWLQAREGIPAFSSSTPGVSVFEMNTGT